MSLPASNSTSIGLVLVGILLVGTGFLVGAKFQRQQPANTPIAQSPPVAAAPSGAIADIEQALSTAPASAGAASSSTPNPPAATGVVNINTADLTELETLSGIGETKAQAIIDYRTQNGPFVRIDDLTNVTGIGPKTVDKIRDQLTL